MITLKGRGLTTPTCQLTITAHALVLRVDDDTNPEFWLEAFIPVEDLAAAVSQMRVNGDGEPLGKLLDQLAAKLRVPGRQQPRPKPNRDWNSLPNPPELED